MTDPNTVPCNGADVVPGELIYRRGETVQVTETMKALLDSKLELDWSGWET